MIRLWCEQADEQTFRIRFTGRNIAVTGVFAITLAFSKEPGAQANAVAKVCPGPALERILRFPQRIYNILTNHAKTLGLLRKIGRFTLELCAKTTACFSLFTEIVRQVCAKKGEGGVVRLINGQLWYCCPVCGQKLHKLTPDAICSGVITFCRKCKWEGVMNIRDRKGA